ncbi:MAG: hypothetical protein QME81_01670 [bacterium]|nr:hypothetical protein [bacterium]
MGTDETEKRGKYELNQPPERKSIQRQKNRKVVLLEKAVGGEIKLWQPRSVSCPDCGSEEVRKQFERYREWRDREGRKHEGSAQVYQCLNHLCETKYFTWLPPGLELWGRFTAEAKRKALSLVVRVRGSYRRTAEHLRDMDDIKVSGTTALAWLRKAAQELVGLEEIFQIRWSGKLVVDEKWVKLGKVSSQ